MPVFGATVSTVQVWVAGVASTLSATSTARTLSVWAPSARSLTRSGDSQAAYSPSSRRHSSRLTPESASAPANDSSAVVAFVAAGGPSTVVVGSVLSSLTSCWMWAAVLAALSAHVPLEETRRLAVSWVTTTSWTSSVAMPDWTDAGVVAVPGRRSRRCGSSRPRSARGQAGRRDPRARHVDPDRLRDRRRDPAGEVGAAAGGEVGAGGLGAHRAAAGGGPVDARAGRSGRRTRSSGSSPCCSSRTPCGTGSTAGTAAQAGACRA